VPGRWPASAIGAPAMSRETPGNVNGAQEQDQGSCPLGVPAVMCINYEITGWGCSDCTVPAAGTEDD
jgi:hypothetical protein